MIKGEQVKLDPPTGDELPIRGFAVEDAGYQVLAEDGSGVIIAVKSDSKRLQLLAFPCSLGRNRLEGTETPDQSQGQVYH